MTAATDLFPRIDAACQDSITDSQAQFFRDNGLLIVRNLLRGEELAAMQRQTLPLVQRASAGRVQDPDYAYMTHQITGQEVPYRIEYVIDKLPAAKALLGHPFILRSIEKLQGRNFIPTWDSMVFKNAGAGAAIVWHRDGAPYSQEDVDLTVAAINVDFYLDGSDLSNCLWGIPGSNLWSAQEARQRIEQLNEGGFRFDGAAPIAMNPGDVLFHNVLVLHGSPPARSQLRRVVYYEFRPAEVESRYGPHVPEYLPLKQRVLLACLRERAKTAYAQGETHYAYQAAPPFAAPVLGERESLPTYRYPHQQYWRT